MSNKNNKNIKENKNTQNAEKEVKPTTSAEMIMPGTMALPPLQGQPQPLSQPLPQPQGNTGVVVTNVSQENRTVSEASLPNLSTMATSTVTLSDGSVTTMTYDPNEVPALAGEQKGETVHSVVADANGVGRNGTLPQMQYNPGMLTQSTPVEGLAFDYNDGLRVQIPVGNYHLKMVDRDDNLVIFDANVSGITIVSTKKYFRRIDFEVQRDGETVFTHEYNAEGKKVRLRYATGLVLGDTFAWFPYAEEFRKKHGCEVYVTINQKMVEILQPGYPDIHFIPLTEDEERTNVQPEGMPGDFYATYILGVFFPCDDRDHQPVDFRVMGLHRNAALILGLNEWEEHPPRLLPSDKEVAERTIKEPYVCIAANGSSQAKHWNNARGWIEVVAYLKKKGYRVLCIDKENTHQVGSYCNTIPFGCEDFTGDRPLQERIDLLYHADFFIGVSSGLSWMAWGVGKPVILISGFTLPVNEFKNPYRVISYQGCNGCWDDTRITFNHTDGEWCPRHKNTERQFECSRNITPEKVCGVIDQVMQDKGFSPKGDVANG